MNTGTAHRGRPGWPRIVRVVVALAMAKHDSGEDDRELTAALGWGHDGRVVRHVGHCGLVAEVPTLAFV